MKILYVSNASNFVGIGGMEYHLLDITTWLEKNGVETGLAVREGTFFQRTILKDRKNVFPLSWTGKNKIRPFLQVGRTIRDFAPDVISINRERDIIRIFLIAKFMGLFIKKRPKLVSVFHNAGWKRFFVLSRLDGVIFPTQFMKQGFLSKNTVAESRTEVIYHGIDLFKVDITDKRNADRERRYFKGMKFPLIGMIGEMRKNQTELIDVAFQLKKKIADFTMVLVGRGTDEEIETLKDKIDRLGLAKNFLLTGRVDRERIPDVLYDLDISVTTNREEPFGIVHIESLAAYTPLVAYDSGGPVEILQKGGGILVQGGPEAMADTLAALISDHALRISMGIAGRDAVEKHFSIDSMGRQHLNFYKRILNQ